MCFIADAQFCILIPQATIFLTLAYTSLTNRLSERKKAGVPVGTFDENKGTMRGGNAVLDNKTVTLPDKLTDFQVWSLFISHFYSLSLSLSFPFLSLSLSSLFPLSLSLPFPLSFSQVRIHVIEARRLEGIDIVSLVKVSCGDKFHKTPSKSGTASPVFDQVSIVTNTICCT